MEERDTEKDKIIYGLPAKYDLVKKHRSACIMAEPQPPKNVTEENCVCCDELINGERYKMCVEPAKLKEHGYGLSLLFTLFTYSIFLISFLSFFSFVEAYFSYTGGYTLPIEKEKKVNPEVEELSAVPQFVAKTSMGNMMRHDIYFNGLLNIGVALILFMAWATYYRQLSDKSIELDMTGISPHDYTIMISGLPTKDLDPDHFLRQCIYEYYAPYWVVRTCFTKDIRKEIKRAEKLNELNMKMSIFENVKSMSGLEKATHMLTKQKTSFQAIVEKVKRKQDKFKGMTEKQFNHAQYAFITFKTVEKAREAFLRFNTEGTQMKYRGKRIGVSKSPDPFDILWENCPISNNEHHMRIFITYTVCLLVSFITGVCNFRFQMWIEANINNIGGDIAARVTSPFIIDIVNMFLNNLVAYFTQQRMEKHKTLTEQEISIGTKSAIVDSVNTILIPLLVQWLWIGDSFYTEGGCCHNLFFVWILVGIIHPLAEYPKCWLWELYHTYKVKKYIKHHDRTQIEANTTKEQPGFSLSGKYSAVAFFVFLTAFGFPLIPLGSVMSIISIGIGYWVYKHLALRVCKKPPRISQKISLYFMKIFGLAIPILLFSNGMFCYLFGDMHEAMPGIIGIAMLIFLYFQRKEFFGEDNLKEGKYAYLCKTEDYDIYEFGKKDYLFFNPATRKQALEEYIKRQIEVEKKDSVKTMLFSGLKQVSAMGMGGSVQMYALDKASKIQKKTTPYPLEFNSKELSAHFNAMLGSDATKPKKVVAAALGAGMMSMALGGYSKTAEELNKTPAKDEEDPGEEGLDFMQIMKRTIAKAEAEEKAEKEKAEREKPQMNLMQIIQQEKEKFEAEEREKEKEKEKKKKQ